MGLEALIRWNSKMHGLIMPNDFIPLVESTQLIHPMTSWVIREVMRKQKSFKENGLTFNCSINLSVKNLYDPNFYNHVMQILREEEADPSYIIFEVTETILLKEVEQSKETISMLKNAGFKFAIDDFGKGYSSLTYLCQFSIDILKIDRYFMSNIAENKSVYEIVSSTVKLAHQLNLQIVAEGIETKEVFDIVSELGCDYIQGYYIAKPIEEVNIIKWCLEYNRNLNINNEK
jgi:EAL domain-containing protein (putative c-di-GMP-specific phosphodiesterase class I)